MATAWIVIGNLMNRGRKAAGTGHRLELVADGHRFSLGETAGVPRPPGLV